VYDDHDYGINDGDRWYPHKKESQAQFLDMLRVPPGDHARREDRNGTYHYHLLRGPAGRPVGGGEGGSGNASGGGGGLYSGKTVAVVTLDARFHRDPYGTAGGDFLGEEQWAWLERTLAASTADVHLVVSSVQVKTSTLSLSLSSVQVSGRGAGGAREG
jgi:alkaline phosphatase D